jgi:hypothetical protein
MSLRVTNLQNVPIKISERQDFLKFRILLQEARPFYGAAGKELIRFDISCWNRLFDLFVEHFSGLVITFKMTGPDWA